MKDYKIRFILFVSVFYFNAYAWIKRRSHPDPAVHFAKALKQAPYDAVIVPGFPHIKDHMTVVVQNRVIWACYLYAQGITKHIIFSGGAVYSPYNEAEIMAMYAMQLGVPAAHIFTETEAEHSTENLYYSYKIANREGFKRIAVATDAAQSVFMSSLNIDRFKIPADFIPIVTAVLKTLPRMKPDIDQDTTLVTDFVSIIDREGWWQRFRGTRGSTVDALMKTDRKNIFPKKSD